MRALSRAPVAMPSAAEDVLARALPAAGVTVRHLWRIGSDAGLRVAIAIPARDEADRIAPCIAAAARACGDRAGAGIVVFVNNSTDGTAAAAVRAALACRARALVVDADTAPDLAHAGWARRIALDLAAAWLGGRGVLMTTDADGTVAPDWVEANLAALALGAHLVCGRVAMHPDDAAALPATMHGPGALEGDYMRLSIELDARLDPRPHDPWPHHGQAAGASLALRAQDYRTLGRLPTPPVGEDRALAALVERRGLTLRHCDAALVTVSGRTTGRAPGGMADAIAARIADPDSPVDQMLARAAVTARRAICRRDLRAALRAGRDPAPVLARLGLTALPPGPFGDAWAQIEATSPRLPTPRLRPSDLPHELPILRRLLARLRA